MATLLLTAAGAALGGAFGTVGAVIGQAAGAIAGSLVDQALFGETREVGRITDLDVQASTEGAPIPRLFGRARVAGQVIWATRFEEEADSAGGKGLGPKVRTYRYYANVAIGLCEGPVAHIGRVWANGTLVDLTRVAMRVHPGGEDGEPDGLILAKEGDAPAYRGTAVVVFEHFPLRDYGNALPQFTFEVIRPVGRLERRIRAVSLIPGATEYGYAAEEVQRLPGEGRAESENRHAVHAGSDLEAALDELQAVLPELEAVSLVVAWFGDTLDCAACALRPKVEYSGKATSVPWRAGGLERADALEVSRVAGEVAYGGTPSDASVVDAIKALKARGLAVTFYPFVMMDVPPGNDLQDPSGGTGQPAFPWRGRITVSPAPGRPGSPDGKPAAAAAVDAFVGTAAPGDFSVSGATVAYAGPAEWTLRRMILHYAALCAAAGGVDSFLIGSEFRGLGHVRREDRRYPFVEALVDLAVDVRAMLGPQTRIGYAADWSEWFGHQPDDGSGDVAFHLDPLWAHPAIDFVGIDAYFPLSDWRDGEHADRAVASGPLDLDHLAGNIAGGELYDWYYANEADRRAGLRTPITDGAAGKPWVFRPKDLVGWWTNPHFDRIGGVEAATPTAWQPGMKPIRFTEAGCPAVDFGPNQPNVFPDRRSSEGAAPRFSRGRRDDAAQRRYLEAFLDRFDPSAPGFSADANPRLVPGGPRMVEHARTHVWTYDARPFPWFPLATDVWTDGDNWETGHWLNGRLGAAPLGETIAALAGPLVPGTVDVRALSPVVDGLVVSDRASARAVIDRLAAVFRFRAAETPDGLVLADRDGRPAAALSRDDLAEEPGRPVVEIRRSEAATVPTEVTVTFLDTASEGRQTTVSARADGPARALDLAVPVSAATSVMGGFADALLADLGDGRERHAFALPPNRLAPEAGDVVTLDLGDRVAVLLVERIADGAVRRVEARAVDPGRLARARTTAPPRRRIARHRTRPRPVSVVLDLPATGGDDASAHRPLVAAAADPWPGTVAVSRGRGSGFETAATLSRPAVIGRLAGPLEPGPVWILDRGGSVEVDLSFGTLAAVSDADLLEGANLAAVGSEEGGWELLQFRDALLVGPSRWRIGGFLRGQAGTEALAAVTHPAGTRFVRVDAALARLDLPADAVGAETTLRIGAADVALSDPSVAERAATAGVAGLLPLAPVRIAATRGPSGDVVITFIRRTRIGGDRFDAPEVPLGEAREAYTVDILDGPATVRSLSVDTPAAVYAAADQIADFGAPPATLDIAVRQLSEAVGPGRTARATVTVGVAG
jgi:hypothetical protein